MSGVEDVLARLGEIDRTLPRHDGAAVFNRMYLRVTEDLASALRRPGTFQDPEFMTRLGGNFAGYWLEAFDSSTSPPVPGAWAALFERRHDRSVLPIQFALAGMNAHIAHDLPVAVVRTCLELDTTPAAAGVRADYDAVNALLAAREERVRRSFLSGRGRTLDRRVGPVVHLVGSWKIEKARDAAWVTAETLWVLRRSRGLDDRYRRALAGSVGLVSRSLLTPVPA